MPESLLFRYAPTASRYDEMVNEIQIPRPHWRGFISELVELPASTMNRRSRFVNESIASDGVTYNVYADPKGAARPWELDIMPLILPATEWRAIEAAVIQRARLLDAVLADLYGPETLLAEGLIPPALIYGQRAHLWPMKGVAFPGKTALHLYAVDIARSPDGRFWVLADRTRGPSGAGYALQNRMTLARAFPNAFRDLSVEPLAPFFDALRDSLQGALAAAHGEEPLCVLLTPGPYNETYFEHAFLARHLGFPLVEGQDLLVRDDFVWLKTLRGLRRVHAILRRLDDDYCDPVELRADSALGVPGLLSAIRAQNVVVANALGSAVLETVALAGFYPAVCERLFGEKLLMPSIATWWCGEAPALEYVEQHLAELVIKPTYPTIRMEPVFGHSLEGAARADLLTRMHAQPHAYTAQEWVRLSQVPTWGPANGLVPRAATLRVFAVRTPSGYSVLPGGLTRVAKREGDVVSMQWGGASKDTWVVRDTVPARAPVNKTQLGPRDVAQSMTDVPSRVGENLFWTGRYAERCEGIARLLRAGLTRLASAAPDADGEISSLVLVCERLGILPPRTSGKTTHTATQRFLAAVADPNIPGGLTANVLRLHACANQARERMSTDNWHVLNRLPQRLPKKKASVGAALESLDEIMLSCVSLAGFAMDDMTRDESWQFLLLGRRIERGARVAAVVAWILRAPPALRADALEWLLEAANSIVTFRARYRRAPELLPVLHLVAFDDKNPHSLLFQIEEAQSTLGRIAAAVGSREARSSEPRKSAPGVSGRSPDDDAPFDALTLLVEAFGAEPLAAFESDAADAHACAAVADLLSRAESTMLSLSDDLQRRFFTHAGTPAPLGAGYR